jgi:HlyD family secretion protein
MLLLGACSSSDEGQILGTLERDRLELIAEANEPIVSIEVREGALVQAGAVLLRQELGAMQARLDQATAARNVAERRLAELTKGPRSQEIAEARATAEAAQSSLITEAREYDRIHDLVERKLLSQSALDQARARRDSAVGLQKQSTARLNMLLEGTRIEELEQAEASLKQAQAALAEVQTTAARYVVTAPRAGRIEAIPYKLGERPIAGAPVIVMLAEGVPYARVHVPEPVRARFTPGARVEVRLDGRDGSLNGVVRYVSAEAAFTPYYALTQEDRSRLSYLAEIDLTDDAAREIPSGIPVQVMLTEAAQ